MTASQGAPALSRRFLLAGAAAVLAGDARAATRERFQHDPGLRTLAASRGLLFGSETTRAALETEPRLLPLLLNECAALVPGHEAKWDYVQPQPGAFHFEDLDWLVDLATGNRLALRLHTLVWSEALPDWVTAALADGTGRRVLASHIAMLVGRYRGRVRCWDVANEIADPRWSTGPEGLTMTPWRRALGPGFVDEAFHLAHAADPAAILCINDDDLEYDTRDAEWKRTTYLRLVEAWKKRGVPIGGFGLQGHLKPDRPFDAPRWRRFLAELAGLGLDLNVTELDVVDRTLAADPAIRDRQAADLVRRYLDATLAETAVSMVMTWGLSDRFSFINDDPDFRRTDGQPSRPLPYDAALRAKPMYEAMAAAFAAAPARS